MADPFKIINVTHPRYTENLEEWHKWRLTYEGGRNFVNTYLETFSRREDAVDFATRKKITYCPRFAGAAIDKIKNAIFQRMSAITREGGSRNYRAAVGGEGEGVDALGSSMNGFMGRKILPELLVMQKVGIYVDMPQLDFEATLADTTDIQPYIYSYQVEDILSWACDSANEFKTLLLRERITKVDPEYGLTDREYDRYRYVWIDETGFVNVRFYNDESKQITVGGEIVEDSTIRLNITKIPFVLLELTHSLMTDIADYQIALLNLSSSDISYILKSNFPFYTEQTDPRTQHFNRRPGSENSDENPEDTKGNEVSIGIAQGRTYPTGTDRPGFIHPSPEPLKASMDKQEQLKSEIQLLLNLAISNLQPSRGSSAESKQADEGSLENGLAYIGLELEHAEQRIAEFWAMYENIDNVAIVKYPATYDLTNEAELQTQAKGTADLIPIIPSATYKKEMAKKMVHTIFSARLGVDIIRKIEREIDAAPAMISDPVAIAKDVEIGLVSNETASLLRGYPAGEVEKAAKDHAERLARIAESQSKGAFSGNGASRGITDLSGSTKDAKDEKKASLDTTKDGVVKDKQRGDAKE